MRFFCLVVAMIAVIAGPRPRAQSLAPFTAADMLKVTTAAVLDLTEDGSRVAVAVRRLDDNAETDHRRYGDPTYIAPSMVELVVFDTRSGASEKPFKRLMNIRQAAWSRDGARLAVLTTAEARDQLPITTAWVWDVAQRTLTEVPRKATAAIAANSELTWLPDGSRLIVALREEAEDRAARAAFKKLVDGPIIVHTSKDSFLEWDALRRGDRRRSLAELDPRTGEARELLPVTQLTDYQLSRDGSLITFREDATEKTDYDVIAGTQNHLVQFGEPHRWDRGVVRLDLATKQMTPLVKDRNLYQNIRYSRDGAAVVYNLSDGDRPADLYVADANFRNARKLTDLNPWIQTTSLPTSELVTYRDTDGKTLYGVLRYPVGYEKGRKYPTVFEIYESFFDNGFNSRAAFLTNHGYAVFHPSVNLVVGRPGESWIKGVTSAANRLIDMSIADPDRLGVHGTSYGGYATVLLITETERFKAAINISGKVNMVSFYTDSPRLGVRNTHAPEKSQDRIGGTLWEYPERYLVHSAVLRADRIKTPLLNITGDQDPNVPASQSREIYYALRRLNREVEWVRYVNGGHRPPNSVSDTIDFENRILAWYDKHLKADSRPPTTPQ